MVEARTFLLPDAIARVEVLARPELSRARLQAALQDARGEGRVRLAQFLAAAGAHRLRNNWQDLLVLRDPIPACAGADPATVRAEERFDGAAVPYLVAQADGGPLLRSFLRALEQVLTAPALHALEVLVSWRTVRAPWHTDNNDELRPFRRFGITTGPPTLFLDVRDLPRWLVLGEDTADYEDWRLRTGVPDLAAAGVVGALSIEPGRVYSWGHDEWHRTPDGAREDDLMIVAELPLGGASSAG